MNRFYSILICLVLLSSVQSIGQIVSQQNDTLVNVVDENGLKQGFWTKVYPNGNIAYEGYFKDDKLTGTFKRYFEEGGISTELFYDVSGLHCKAILYHNTNTIAATGNYIDKNKDSIWTYYSKDQKIIAKESYVNGKKHGIFRKFYKNGLAAEEENYVDDVKHGAWNKYYPNGKPKMEAMYKNGMRNGLFYFYYDNGKVEISGAYSNDLRHNVWIFYKPNGKEDFRLEYEYGIAKDIENLDKGEKKKFDEYEKNRRELKDPDDFMNNPEEYFR